MQMKGVKVPDWLTIDQTKKTSKEQGQGRNHEKIYKERKRDIVFVLIVLR